jgi:hypothetical protein
VHSKNLLDVTPPTNSRRAIYVTFVLVSDHKGVFGRFHRNSITDEQLTRRINYGMMIPLNKQWWSKEMLTYNTCASSCSDFRMFNATIDSIVESLRSSLSIMDLLKSIQG